MDNKLLKTTILKRFGTRSAFADFAGVRPTELGLLIRGGSPFGDDGDFTKTAKDTMEALGCCPRDIFDHYCDAFVEWADGNYSEIDMDVGVLRHDLERFISKLLANEQTVVRLRFFEERSLEEVGEHLNLSRERIRQIEVKALRKIRNSTMAKSRSVVAQSKKLIMLELSNQKTLPLNKNDSRGISAFKNCVGCDTIKSRDEFREWCRVGVLTLSRLCKSCEASYQKQYYVKTKSDKVKMYSANMPDSYIVGIFRHKGLLFDEITAEMIELKRKDLMLKRVSKKSPK